MDDLLGLELVVVLGVVLLACGVLARRLRIAPPVLLLTGGVLLGSSLPCAKCICRRR
jgi:Kef-type K+ transport system membrane component KefB